MRTVNAAIAKSEEIRLSQALDWAGLCERLVRTSYGENTTVYPSASAHWKAIPAKYKHTGKPLRGGIAFWLNKSGTGFGHVALCVNDIGSINSNDIIKHGRVDRVDYQVIEKRWGLVYVGWADPWWDEINKLVVPHPVISYTYRQGKRVFSNKMKSGVTKSDSVWNLSLALHIRGYLKSPPTVNYTPGLRAACKQFQLRNGWSGSDADGLAGPQTAKKLGLLWVAN